MHTPYLGHMFPIIKEKIDYPDFGSRPPLYHWTVWRRFGAQTPHPRGPHEK